MITICRFRYLFQEILRVTIYNCTLCICNPHNSRLWTGWQAADKEHVDMVDKAIWWAGRAFNCALTLIFIIWHMCNGDAVATGTTDGGLCWITIQDIISNVGNSNGLKPVRYHLQALQLMTFREIRGWKDANKERDGRRCNFIRQVAPCWTGQLGSMTRS